MSRTIFGSLSLLFLLLLSPGCGGESPPSADNDYGWAQIGHGPIPLPTYFIFSCAFPPEHQATVREAFLFWNDQLGDQLFIEREDCLPESVEVQYGVWIMHAHKNDFSPNGADRNAETILADDDGWGSGEIKFWKPWFYDNRGYKISTARHEVGHVLGFAHSPDANCLMYPYDDYPNQGLCPAEKDELLRVYGARN